MLETEDQNRRLRGLALPALRDRGGYFKSKDALEIAWGDLLMALLTPIGSRPMLRAFGSTLHRMLFDPTMASALKIRYIVFETAQRWTPHVRVYGVSVNTEGREVEVKVTFGLRGSSDFVTRQVPVSLAGQGNAASQPRRLA